MIQQPVHRCAAAAADDARSIGQTHPFRISDALPFDDSVRQTAVRRRRNQLFS